MTEEKAQYQEVELSEDIQVDFDGMDDCEARAQVETTVSGDVRAIEKMQQYKEDIGAACDAAFRSAQYISVSLPGVMTNTLYRRKPKPLPPALVNPPIFKQIGNMTQKEYYAKHHEARAIPWSVWLTDKFLFPFDAACSDLKAEEVDGDDHTLAALEHNLGFYRHFMIWTAGSQAGQWPFRESERRTWQDASVLDVCKNFISVCARIQKGRVWWCWFSIMMLAAAEAFLPYAFANITDVVQGKVYDSRQGRRNNCIYWIVGVLAIHVFIPIVTWYRNTKGIQAPNVVREINFHVAGRMLSKRPLAKPGGTAAVMLKDVPEAVGGVWVQFWDFMQSQLTFWATFAVLVGQKTQTDLNMPVGTWFGLLIAPVFGMQCCLFLVFWSHTHHAVDLQRQYSQWKKNLAGYTAAASFTKSAAQIGETDFNKEISEFWRVFQIYALTNQNETWWNMLSKLSIPVCVWGIVCGCLIPVSFQVMDGNIGLSDFILIVACYSKMASNITSLGQSLIGTPKMYVSIQNIAGFLNLRQDVGKYHTTDREMEAFGMTSQQIEHLVRMDPRCMRPVDFHRLRQIKFSGIAIGDQARLIELGVPVEHLAKMQSIMNDAQPDFQGGTGTGHMCDSDCEEAPQADVLPFIKNKKKFSKYHTKVFLNHKPKTSQV